MDQRDDAGARTLRLTLTSALLLITCSASADIFKWTDEQGGTVYSNTPPEQSKKAANVERVLKERAAPPAEQKLIERIDELERRLQARANPPPAPAPTVAATPPYYDNSYYEPPPAPPVYVGYPVPVFPVSYAFPLRPAHSYVVYPRRVPGARPMFRDVARGPGRTASFHHGRRY